MHSDLVHCIFQLCYSDVVDVNDGDCIGDDDNNDDIDHDSAECIVVVAVIVVGGDGTNKDEDIHDGDRNDNDNHNNVVGGAYAAYYNVLVMFIPL